MEEYGVSFKEACEILDGDFIWEHGRNVCVVEYPKNPHIANKDIIKIVSDNKNDNIYVTSYKNGSDEQEAIKVKHGYFYSNGDDIRIKSPSGKVIIGRNLHRFIMVDTKNWYEMR